MIVDQEKWEFINTFAPWLSAFGTVVVASIALYVARRSTKIKIRLRHQLSQMLGTQPTPTDPPEYLSLSVHNESLRPVTISGIYWTLGKFKKHNFLQLSPRNEYSNPIPTKLELDEEANYLFELDSLPERMEAILSIIRSSRFRKYTISTIRVGVYTTNGTKKYCRLNKHVKEWLGEQL